MCSYCVGEEVLYCCLGLGVCVGVGVWFVVVGVDVV